MSKKNKAFAIFAVRAAAEMAVKKLEPQCGSKMLAYAKVAVAVDVSASWLRKFIMTPGTPEPRWSVGYAIINYYNDLCDAVDVQVNEQRRDITKIIGEINAIDPFSDHQPLAVSLARRLSFGAED